MTQPGEMERRAATELRASGGRKLVGLAAVFNSPARIGGFTERVMPTAFDASLRTAADVRALVDHQDSNLLGRTSAGTLALHVSARGLEFEIDAPDTQLGNDILTLTKRGDVKGCSFAFRVPPGGDAWPARDQRELRSVDLVEISILRGLPAYDDTSVSARAAFRAASVDTARLRHLFLRTM